VAVWILDDEIMRFSREGFRSQANKCTFALPMVHRIHRRATTSFTEGGSSALLLLNSGVNDIRELLV
jgi:hypothetical protein